MSTFIKGITKSDADASIIPNAHVRIISADKVDGKYLALGATQSDENGQFIVDLGGYTAAVWVLIVHFLTPSQPATPIYKKLIPEVLEA